MNNKHKLYLTNKLRYDKLKELGLCKGCMTPLEDLAIRHCTKCRLKNAAGIKKLNTSLKLKAFEMYGGCKCNCCGIDTIAFLTIDHVNNDGNIHRREDKQAKNNMYRWLAKNNYPEGFQVLCWNCNMGKQINGGVCPHNE